MVSSESIWGICMTRLVQFWRNEKASTAIMLALAATPAVGMVGVALDYARASNLRVSLQSAADATTLQMVAARKNGQTPDYKQVFASELRSSIPYQDLIVDGSWLTTERFALSAKVRMRNSLAALIQPDTEVGASAVAEATQFSVQVAIEGAQLSPEAADYNEIYAYCYNQTDKKRLGPLDPAYPNDPSRRLPFPKVADNSDAGIAKPPQNLVIKCDKSENQSLQLRNVRNARTKTPPTGTTYNHYTDVTIPTDGPDKGIPKYNTSLIEVIICETKAICVPKSQGGILPNNHQTGRTPAKQTRPCNPGEYIYFGWEDRPGGDADYDDIRIVQRCGGTIPGKYTVRLIS